MNKIQYQTDGTLMLDPAPAGKTFASYLKPAAAKWTRGSDSITIHQGGNNEIRLTRHQLLELATAMPEIIKDLQQDSDNETDACSGH